MFLFQNMHFIFTRMIEQSYQTTRNIGIDYWNLAIFALTFGHLKKKLSSMSYVGVTSAVRIVMNSCTISFQTAIQAFILATHYFTVESIQTVQKKVLTQKKYPAFIKYLTGLVIEKYIFRPQACII